MLKSSNKWLSLGCCVYVFLAWLWIILCFYIKCSFLVSIYYCRCDIIILVLLHRMKGLLRPFCIIALKKDERVIRTRKLLSLLGRDCRHYFYLSMKFKLIAPMCTYKLLTAINSRSFHQLRNCTSATDKLHIIL